jgi:PPOX class probable F420-dependent enzyme
MTDAPSSPAAAGLSARVRAFLKEPNFATIATLGDDGMPHQAVIWYRMDGDAMIINSAVGRRWPADLVRDPRISVAVTDHRDGYRWIGFSGRVELIRDQPTAQADIAAMARSYHADDPAEAERIITGRFQRQERISFRIAIGAVHEHLD